MRQHTLRLLAYCTSAFALFSCVPHTPAQAAGVTLYVSPAGNDAWSGALAAPNAGQTDGPFATVAKAQAAIRAHQAAGGLTAPVTVLLRGGVYPQGEPLVFTAEDSGTEAGPITYAAYPGEQPVISGGVPISGWQPDGKLWKTSVPKTAAGTTWLFNQLFVNGERRTRARIPNKGSFLRTDGPRGRESNRSFYFREGDLKEWNHLSEAIVVAYHSWETSIHHIRSVDTESCQVILREPAPWPMGRWEKEQRYYVENVFEGLDEPGEWYLDISTATLYYYPMPGEQPATTVATAPVLTSTLVEIKGEPAQGKFVDQLHFRGISFQYSNANLRRLRNPGQGEIYQPGLIQAVGLRQSSFVDCEIAHTAAHGIWFAAGCSDNRLERCHIHDLGGGGVYIGGGWGIQDNTPAGKTTVDNNFIHDGGYLFHGAHGVWIGKSSYNVVTHNEISNFDYSAISCGWSWGFQPTTANHNNLDFNYIHHLSNGEGLSDMGGIYTLGVSPGTTERNNHIHDVYNYAPVSHGSGIYPDEGSSDILIENNVVYRVRTCTLFMHYGQECTVRNNIFAFGGKGLMQRCREDKRCNYAAEGNLLYNDIPNMLGGVWKSNDWTVGHNLYWSTAGEPTFMGMDFATWQVKGKDEGSIVADPLFVDPANGDFRLQPNSPALKLGFQPIDVSQAGLYGDKAWTALPGKYPNRALNEVPPPVVVPLVINFDFEGEEAGGEPVEGSVIKGENGASILVADDTAASGKQSLKFTDAPGQPNSWTPHIFYKKICSEGKVKLAWDMCNSAESPASFYVELRQYSNAAPYLVGPTVSVAQDGAVTASDQAVGTIPLGQWAHVEIIVTLGEGAPKTYQLTLTAPGQNPVTRELPYRNPAFRTIEWLGISSTTETASVFHIDNLQLGTAEELSQPPKHRPRSRARVQKAPRGPGNDQQLMAYWTFDENEGYTVKDHSGFGNDGETWALLATGSFGSALYCDPGNTHVSVSDDETLQFGTGDFAIELWMCPTMLKIDDSDARRRFLSKNAYPATYFGLDITSAGNIIVEMVDSNKAGCRAQQSGAVPENAWTLVTVVVDRTNRQVRYYLDGALDCTREIPATFTGPVDVVGKDLTIGSNWHPFVGLLDEVRIYKRALTEAEIKATYEREKGQRTSAEYKLVE